MGAVRDACRRRSRCARSAFEAALLAEMLEDAADPALGDPAGAGGVRGTRALRALAAREARPRLMALLAAAGERGLPQVLDDDTADPRRRQRRTRLPARGVASELAAVPWSELHDVPTAIVTGSNGKTTTVRLLAACARAHGWPSAYCCTDGVFFDGQLAVASGDYSGPDGARRVLRERRAQAAIIETARGGILRRGLAISRAHVAVVTNVSADHFGEYGIDDLAGACGREADGGWRGRR